MSEVGWVSGWNEAERGRGELKLDAEIQQTDASCLCMCACVRCAWMVESSAVSDTCNRMSCTHRQWQQQCRGRSAVQCSSSASFFEPLGGSNLFGPMEDKGRGKRTQQTNQTAIGVGLSRADPSIPSPHQPAHSHQHSQLKPLNYSTPHTPLRHITSRPHQTNADAPTHRNVCCPSDGHHGAPAQLHRQCSRL